MGRKVTVRQLGEPPPSVDTPRCTRAVEVNGLKHTYRHCEEPAEFYNIQDERNLVCVGHYLEKTDYERHWWIPLPHADGPRSTPS